MRRFLAANVFLSHPVRLTFSFLIEPPLNLLYGHCDSANSGWHQPGLDRLPVYAGIQPLESAKNNIFGQAIRRVTLFFHFPPPIIQEKA